MLTQVAPADGQAIKTQVVQGDGKWQLLRDGQPYLIKGAGGIASKALLREIGGNSIRTWGADNLDEQLDEAHKLGLSVCVGIWLGQERSGFSYDSDKQVAEQFERAKQTIEKHKNHPAVLMWGIGNEMEGFKDGDKVKIWQAVNDIAAMAKKLDPNHPTMTVVAEIGGQRVQCIHKYCPDIDIVGINTYAGIASIPERYRKVGGTKPYVITEAGVPGTWETPKTKWGTVQEMPSSAKREFYHRGWVEAVEKQPGLAFGEYVFNWGQKQEATETWFGMFLQDGSRLEPVDTMQELWTGRAPQNRCPQVDAIKIVGSQEVAPGAEFAASANVSDPENDPVKVEWMLRREPSEYKEGGDREDPTMTFPDAIVKATDGAAQIRMPANPGGYRLYVFARDGKGGAATANIPLHVIEAPPAAR
ncbi:glycoside hydrolase family 2 TIM barrel-domain containing protein [soil metagenome]